MNTKIFYKFTDYILNTDISNSTSININDRLTTNYEKSLFYYNTFKNYYTYIEKIRDDYTFPFSDCSKKIVNKNLLKKIFENFDFEILLKLKNHNYDFKTNNSSYDHIISHYCINKDSFLKFILENDIFWSGKLLINNFQSNLDYIDYNNELIETKYQTDINNYKNFLEIYLNKYENINFDSKKIIIFDLIKYCLTELIDEYFENILNGQQLCYYINLNDSNNIFDIELLEKYNIIFTSDNYYDELILYLNIQYN